MAALLNAANAALFPDNPLPAFKTMLKFPSWLCGPGTKENSSSLGISAPTSTQRAGRMVKHKPNRKRSAADEGLILFAIR